MTNVSEEVMSKVIPGMQNFTSEDLIFPAIKLIHPTSEFDKGNPGQFYNTVTEDVFDDLTLTLVTFRKESKAWPDKKTGELGEPKPQYILLALTDKSEPVMLYVGGVAFWGLRAYFNQFFQAGLPLWSVKTKITSEKKTGDNGVYFVSKFESGEEVAEAEQAKTLAFFEGQGQKAIESNESDDRDAVDGVQDVAV